MAGHSCPALFISAPASNQGKTTVTAAIARHHRRLGRRVKVFKTGPDFLDPMILARASGEPVYSLHLSMVGEAGCRALLARAAADADLILVEGVMGLFDGKPSGADLACTFNIPVLAVIDGQAMAQTFAAIAFGLAQFRPALPFHGVFANRIGSQGHADMLTSGLPENIRWCGHMPTDIQITLPERHLGLLQADEIDDLDARLDHAADAIGTTSLATLPAPVHFDDADSPPLPALLDGKCIAVARDAAFSFIYPANLDLLRGLGARVEMFSPLADEPVPASADALFLPGGYPELHMARLRENEHSNASIRAHIANGKPTVAECGGMLYLLDGLTDKQGVRWPGLGILPGEGIMQERLAGLGMHRLDIARDSAHGSALHTAHDSADNNKDSTAPSPDTLTGHTFHYSRMTTPLEPQYHTRHATRGTLGEAVYRQGALIASYFHAYWPSNPEVAAALFLGETR